MVGRTLGLVAPGYTMAEVVVDRLLGGEATFTEADLSTKLKLLSVDPVAGVYKQLVLSDNANVCSCNIITAGTVRDAVRVGGCTDLGAVKACTRAGSSCGSCLPLVKRLVITELEAAGVSVSRALCEHFALSQAQLFDVVRDPGLRTFIAIVARHGAGRGCDICKPVVASILASLGVGHVGARRQASRPGQRRQRHGARHHRQSGRPRHGRLADVQAGVRRALGPVPGRPHRRPADLAGADRRGHGDGCHQYGVSAIRMKRRHNERVTPT